MGSWGTGVFENDYAQEVLEEAWELTDREISGFLESDRVGIEDLDQVIACVAIENALSEGCGGSRRELDVALALQKKVLAIFDAEAEEFSRRPSWPSERRTVLAAALERMVTLAKRTSEPA